MEKSTQNKRPPGRPKGWRADNPKSVRLPAVNVTPDQLDDYKQAAESVGSNFSKWVRDNLDLAVKRVNRKQQSE